MDTGANMLLSRCASDFQSWTQEGAVRIGGTAGEVRGVVGILRPNALGYVRGVYVESLPVDRILPWCGADGLVERGFTMELFPEKGVVMDSEGKSYPLVYSSKIRLPVLGFDLFDLSAGSSCHFSDQVSPDLVSDKVEVLSLFFVCV